MTSGPARLSGRPVATWSGPPIRTRRCEADRRAVVGRCPGSARDVRSCEHRPVAGQRRRDRPVDRRPIAGRAGRGVGELDLRRRCVAADRRDDLLRRVRQVMAPVVGAASVGLAAAEPAGFVLANSASSASAARTGRPAAVSAGRRRPGPRRSPRRAGAGAAWSSRSARRSGPPRPGSAPRSGCRRFVGSRNSCSRSRSASAAAPKPPAPTRSARREIGVPGALPPAHHDSPRGGSGPRRPTGTVGQRRGTDRLDAAARDNCTPADRWVGMAAQKEAAMGSGDERRLREIVERVTAEAGYDLDELTVTPAGRRRVVRVIIDPTAGISLDAAAEISRAISERAGLTPATTTRPAPLPYTLEVTSRGIGRPLTLPRHFRRARTRLVAADHHRRPPSSPAMCRHHRRRRAAGADRTEAAGPSRRAVRRHRPRGGRGRVQPAVRRRSRTGSASTGCGPDDAETPTTTRRHDRRH